MTYRSEMLLTEMSFVKETKSSSTDAFEKFQIYSSVNTISRHVCCMSLLTCGSGITPMKMFYVLLTSSQTDWAIFGLFQS